MVQSANVNKIFLTKLEQLIEKINKQEGKYDFSTNDDVIDLKLKKISKKKHLIGKVRNLKGVMKCNMTDKDGDNCGYRLTMTEYKVLFGGNIYIFFDELLHYYKEHQVKPSKEFEEVILNFCL